MRKERQLLFVLIPPRFRRECDLFRAGIQQQRRILAPNPHDFSLLKRPPYASCFHIVAGSMRDVSSLILTVKEGVIKNAVLISDKGFYSEANVLDLEKGRKTGLHYI
ncbi:MAG: hypothetical protein N2V78_12335 [Methanophagales archaeon]|nr:hypothetical protein [Methanophagales archaeon]